MLNYQRVVHDFMFIPLPSAKCFPNLARKRKLQVKRVVTRPTPEARAFLGEEMPKNVELVMTCAPCNQNGS
jgi:hypothetical protein